jgi:hypothetical protein
VRKFLQGLVFEVGKTASSQITKKALLPEAAKVVKGIRHAVPIKGTLSVRQPAGLAP